jgi:hypothetical protein
MQDSTGIFRRAAALNNAEPNRRRYCISAFTSGKSASAHN